METADQCVDHSWGVAVDDWVRNTVMLTAQAVWVVYVTVTLVRGGDIDAIVWGFPGAVYFAMNPTFKRGGKDGQA